MGEEEFCDRILGEMHSDVSLGLCLRGIENLCERKDINKVESMVGN